MTREACVLADAKVCNGCQECLVCDLNSKKKCDNCCQCLEDNKKDYGVIDIDEIIF